MKNLLRILLTLLLAQVAHSASAQGSLIAFGRVSAAGTITRSASTIGATVEGFDSIDGRCVVNVSKDGEFIGATEDDFAIYVTQSTPLYSKRNCTASISFVSDNQVSINVRTSDVEDSTDLSAHVSEDTSFYFALHRLPTDGRISPDSPFLFATGRVSPGGSLTTNVSVPGFETSSAWISDGRTELTFAKPGAFADDDASDYVVIATPWSSSSQDKILNVHTSDFSSDDSVTIRFRSYDAQDQANDDTIIPEDEAVYYTIYRVPGGGQGVPFGSQLNVALGRVDGSTGDVIGAATPFPDASVTATRLGAGSYHVFVESPGAFRDAESYDMVVQLTVDHGTNIDEVASGRLIVVNDDTLRLDVQIDDVEEAGTDNGTPTDRNFFFLAQTAVPDLKSDMKIGRKRSLSKMKGDNRYNSNAAGQKVKAKSRGAGARYFFALQNDGNLQDTLTLRKAGKSRGVKPRFIRLTGGRANVTAVVKSGKFAQPDVTPGQSVQFQAKVRLRGDSARRSKVRLMSQSKRGGGGHDVCLAKVVGRQ